MSIEKSAERQQPGMKPCDRQSRQILEFLQLNDKYHEILRENLATYLYNLREPVPGDRLASISRFRSWLDEKGAQYKAMKTAGGEELARWPSKISRDLERPYTDRQVGERLEEVADRFQAQYNELQEALPGYPREFLAYGGSISGRFGGNSDLDYCYSDPCASPNGQGPYSRDHTASGYAQMPDDFIRRKKLIMEGSQRVVLGGPAILLEGRHPWQSFKKIVIDRMEERGLHVNSGWIVSRTGFPVRHFEDLDTDQERARKTG